MLAEYLAGVDWEPASAIGLRICRLLVAIMLARVDGKSPVEYLGADQQVLVRTFCRHAISAQFTDLETITGDWCRHIKTFTKIPPP
jgi:hypothetical protein